MLQVGKKLTKKDFVGLRLIQPCLSRLERLKAVYREEYQAKDNEVKKQLRRDRRNWIDQIASDAEKAAKTGNMKAVFDATRQLCGKQIRRTDSVRIKEGILLTEEEEV